LSTGFDEAGVSVLSIPPARTLAAEAALLNGKHLKGVLDTFSAALALARTEGKSPCERKIEILDQQQPFDMKPASAAGSRSAKARR